MIAVIIEDMFKIAGLLWPKAFHTCCSNNWYERQCVCVCVSSICV